MTRATVTGLIDGLTLDGLVTLAAGELDRRRKAIMLTPKGEALIDKALPDIFQRMAELTAPLLATNAVRRSGYWERSKTVCALHALLKLKKRPASDNRCRGRKTAPSTCLAHRRLTPHGLRRYRQLACAARLSAVPGARPPKQQWRRGPCPDLGREQDYPLDALFHLGAFCLSWAAIRASGDASRTFRRWFCVGAVTWIGLWIIPAWPGPYVAVFAGGGVLILLLISVAFGRAALTGEPYAGTRSEHWRIASAFFFALATWDVCGLGSVGGILHPNSSSRAANQGLVVTQTTKLIIEFVIAWALVAIATVPLGRGVSATRAPRAGSTGDGLAGTSRVRIDVHHRTRRGAEARRLSRAL